jgi:hypothetical protein
MFAPVPRATYANVVATLAFALAAAALALVLLGDDDDDADDRPASAPPEAPASVASADVAKRAERADRADTADTAALATRAKQADRLRGSEDRRLRAASRRARGVVPGVTVRTDMGEERPLLRSGPFSFRLKCSRGPRRQVLLEISARSSEPDATMSVDGTPGQSVPTAREKVIVRLLSPRPLWSGGRGFTIETEGGEALHGMLAFGISRLGSDCAASMSGMS